MKHLFHFNVLSVANMPIRNLQLFRRKGDRNWQEAEAGGHYTCKMKEDRNGNVDQIIVRQYAKVYVESNSKITFEEFEHGIHLGRFFFNDFEVL